MTSKLSLVILGAALTFACAAYAAPAGYHAQRICKAPAPGSATCMAFKLVPNSLTAAARTAAAARQDQAVRRARRERRAHPFVEQKTPLSGGLTPAMLHEAYALPNETAAAAHFREYLRVEPKGPNAREVSEWLAQHADDLAPRAQLGSMSSDAQKPSAAQKPPADSPDPAPDGSPPTGLAPEAIP